MEAGPRRGEVEVIDGQLAEDLWKFLPLGYLLTVAIELPILLLGLARPRSWGQRILAGLALTAFTYPIVVLVLPALLWGTAPYWVYLVVAESFAPLAECGLYWLAFAPHQPRWSGLYRDLVTIVVANLASFLIGLVLADLLR